MLRITPPSACCAASGERQRAARRQRVGPSALQNYGVNMAAVIGLRPMHRAAIAEEALVGIGVDAEVIDHKHACLFKPPADQSGQIEHRMAFAPGWNKKDGIVGVVLNKAFDEFVADLVGVLA